MNLLEIFFILIILFHAFLMLVDEFYCHKKRWLPKWERIGHPVDTACFLLCYILVIFFPMNKAVFFVFLINAVFSCFLIVKDEAVHLKYANSFEQYLHALLFVLHPVILCILFFSWSLFAKSEFLFFNYFDFKLLKYVILTQFILAIIFFWYQIIYWNFVIKDNVYDAKRNSK